MAIADFAQAFEVAQRRHEYAGRATGSTITAAIVEDHAADRGAPARRRTRRCKLRLAPGEGVARQVVGVPDVVDASDPGPNTFLLSVMPPTAMPPKFTPW